MFKYVRLFEKTKELRKLQELKFESKNGKLGELEEVQLEILETEIDFILEEKLEEGEINPPTSDSLKFEILFYKIKEFRKLTSKESEPLLILCSEIDLLLN